MSLPPILQNLPLPIIGSPLFIISNPQLVIEQCKAGVVGVDAGAQCTAGRAARRVAGRDHRGAGGPRPRPSGPTGGAVCDQPDRAQEQRPARARHAGVRQVQGADRHHLTRRAHRCQRCGARLGRHRAARHHQRLLRPQGDRQGRRRPDRRGRRGRRTCRHQEPVRAGAGDPRLVRRSDRPQRLDRHRRCGAGGAGHGRRFRVHRIGLHRHRRGAGGRCLQADDRRRARRTTSSTATCSPGCSATT